MQPLHSFLSQVMWRSSKDEVVNQVCYLYFYMTLFYIILVQINIPKQTTKEYWLDFSAVEHYFYRCEHQLNYNAFLDKTRPYDPDLAMQSLDRSSLKTVVSFYINIIDIKLYIPASCATIILATSLHVSKFY